MTEDEAGLQRDIAAVFAELWGLVGPRADAKPDDVRAIARRQLVHALERGAFLTVDGGDLDLPSSTFRPEQLLHEGEWTRIYWVRHRDLGSLHVLKTLTVSAAMDPAFRQGIVEEARLGLALQHPHLIETQMLIRLDDGRPAILLEACGPSASALLQAGALDAKNAVTILRHALSALSALHASGHVHGDVAADNMLAPAAEGKGWKLCDFGLSLRAGLALSARDIAFGGRKEYAAPEQRAGLALMPASDLFGLGRLAGMFARGITEDREDQHTLVELGLKRFEMAVCRTDINKRPADAGACLALLENCLENPGL